MSNALAIAAVTGTIRNLLLNSIPELPNPASLTTKPPDQARGSNSGNQLNLFLYHVLPDAAWRNMDMPRQVRPGETAPPPLALVLEYLITAYGDEDHRVLGRAMSVLHDHPLLNPAEIEAALAEADLHLQVERVRVTLQPLSLEDMYRLWNGFQTQYRVSAAYQIAVVLIESTRSAKAPLPVLRRGAADDGVHSVAGATPVLSALVLPNSQPSAQFGDTIVIQGSNLSADNVTVRFVNTALPAPVELTPSAGDQTGEIKVALPGAAVAMDTWAPGLYTLSLVVARPNLPVWTTNELSLGIAPSITRTPAAVSPGDTLTVTAAPRIRDGQRVFLTLGDQQTAPAGIANPADTTKPTSVTFTVPPLASGAWVARLRVDGIDSIPVIQQGVPPLPAFDPAQTVTI